VRENRSTVLFATPTFLLGYVRKVLREDFASLRVVVAGAEKLKPRVADLFQEKFGLRPLEGYGCTELSPVAALNIPDVEVGGIKQVGTREGTIGQPIPGVVMRVVDPDTGRPLPPGEAGLLLVRGPNVMRGYLNQPERTAEVMRDGWYVTGDIASIDTDGFVTITDRLSRFSKIAGEMIPHQVVEEEYLRRLQAHEPVLAVASVPDEKRGERLVVLYTEAAGPPETLQRLIAESELPNLWKPGRNSYYRVDHIPILGSGKLDLVNLRKSALAVAGPAAARQGAGSTPSSDNLSSSAST
jgi:acyl-[acyl-carrier-protein]-phospholipid O-acyltransferase/long-chain-fatty-acid--[acyl-carrier-protein] ligase